MRGIWAWSRAEPPPSRIIYDVPFDFPYDVPFDFPHLLSLREAQRVLTEDGKIIVIEQLRNVANFACFGVAAMHFHSRRTWMKAFTAAELAVTKEFAITPFVRVYVVRSISKKRDATSSEVSVFGSPSLQITE